MNHTLRLFYRNFRKHAVINLINMGGLALSMVVVLLLSAYCYSELTTDSHHNNPGESFLITKRSEKGNMGIFSPAILAEHLSIEIPEIKNVVRFAGTWESVVLKAEEGRTAYKTELIFADTSFFKIFNYHELRGDLDIALSDPSSMVLTKSEALRLFGKIDVIGEMVYIDNKHLVKVTAVIEQPENNSFLSFQALVPLSDRKTITPNGKEFTSWGYQNFQTIVQIQPGADLDKIETEIEQIYVENSKENSSKEIYLLPLEKIYFADINNSWTNFIKTGDFSKVAILMIVAVLILIIALINFVNISSYSLKERLRQTGIFKIIGATQKQVLANLIFESLLLFACSFWIAVLLTEVIQPYVSRYTGISYINKQFFSPSFIGISFSIAIFLGIITNIISSIRHAFTHPIQGLKREYNGKIKGRLYQSYLVIFQFCAAIILITFTLLVQKQIKYGADGLGYNDENTIAIKLTKQLKKEVLKDKLSSLSNTGRISLTQFYPGKPVSNWGITLPIDGEDKDIKFSIFDADATFLDMLDIELVSGRFYTDTTLADKNKLLINESFVKEYEIENLSDISISGFSGKTLEAVGVIKDFHYKSKNHAIGPLVIKNTGSASYCLVEISSQQFAGLSTTVEEIKEISSKLSPDFPVEISFMDQAVERMYQSEIMFQRTFTFFAGCAIFLSCLGILALSLFAGQQRTKEIGIRKVNGAHVEDILLLLNKDFIRWVMIAFVIATPIAYFSMTLWLESFAYKTEISWWIFIIGGCFALLIAIATVSWQSWSAAQRNPVEALRYE